MPADSQLQDGFGITPQQYEKCSWGLLLPDNTEDEALGSYGEINFLLNLYSPSFLYPIFSVDRLGIRQQDNRKNSISYDYFQNQAHLFKTKKFVEFFEKFISQSLYGTWQLYRSQQWENEDWRLFSAALLFSGLKKYDNGKDVFTWQREAADTATIMETLFTAGDTQAEEVGYRLRKRVAVLMGFHFPNIEDEIKNLYKQRSTFIHGEFFRRFAQETRNSPMNLPNTDFDFLYKQKEYAKWALVAYLNLARALQVDRTSFNNATSVLNLLEQAIIDVKLRRKISAETKMVFKLMPPFKPSPF